MIFAYTTKELICDFANLNPTPMKLVNNLGLKLAQNPIFQLIWVVNPIRVQIRIENLEDSLHGQGSAIP